ncbi:MAG: TRAP transporter small permease [Xanthobacteraceae bacterium]|jgi:TRAP-type C4-dicarboxylate transport system permease small subunit|uniref:TRAP transporter small permease n=1 Tax=Pseudolabrys sp. TaxID=1960880 RepID=UPI003D0EFF0C
MPDNVDQRGLVDRFIDAIEKTAAAFLAAVTALTFVSVFLRYIFIWSIPDSYDLISLGLGILIFWGIASASYRNEHITVDLLYGAAPRWAQRAMMLFSDIVTLGSLVVFTWMVALKVINTHSDNVATFDLRQPVWIYYFIAWVGLAAAIMLMVIRAIRVDILRQPEPKHSETTAVE